MASRLTDYFNVNRHGLRGSKKRTGPSDDVIEAKPKVQKAIIAQSPIVLIPTKTSTPVEHLAEVKIARQLRGSTKKTHVCVLNSI